MAHRQVCREAFRASVCEYWVQYSKRRSLIGISLIKAMGQSRILFEHGQYFVRRA
jgi:hypothetical protein